MLGRRSYQNGSNVVIDCTILAKLQLCHKPPAWLQDVKKSSNKSDKAKQGWWGARNHVLHPLSASPAKHAQN